MLGESCSDAEVFGDGGGYEDLRLGQVRRDDAVDDVAGQSRIVERRGADSSAHCSMANGAGEALFIRSGGSST